MKSTKYPRISKDLFLELDLRRAFPYELHVLPKSNTIGHFFTFLIIFLKKLILSANPTDFLF